MEGKYIKVNNVSVYVEEYMPKSYGRDTPDVCLIHGLVSSVHSFKPVIPKLAEFARVIALDLPGFGKSEKGTGYLYSYENYAATIAELMEILSVKKITAVGHSMGGQICLYLAKYYPDLISELVLMAPSSYVGRSSIRLRLATYLPLAPLCARFLINRSDLRNIFKSVVYDEKHADDESYQIYVTPFKDKAFYQSLIGLIRHREGDLKDEDLYGIAHHTLLLWGENDQVVPLSIGERLSTQLSQASFITYPKTGHLLPKEQPEKTLTEMINFLEERGRFQRLPKKEI